MADPGNYHCRNDLLFCARRLFRNIFGGEFSSLLIMLVVGIPLYICASASTPIAAAMVLKGLSPGAALVFLLAGPATNAATITVIAKHLGRAATIVYISVISILSLILAGWSIDSTLGSRLMSLSGSIL